MLMSAWCTQSLFEIMPLKSMRAQIPFLPQRMRVHVTRSPGTTCEDTLFAARQLRLERSDLTVVPHLAARTIRDRRHLGNLIDAMHAADINDAFVIAGDATDDVAGCYTDALGVIRDMRQYFPDFGHIAVAGYPDGHPFIGRADLAAALTAKAPLVNAISTQLCFDPETIITWLQSLRSAGIELPVLVGVPSPLKRTLLLRIATQIGVGTSLRFLRHNAGMLGGLSGMYTPDAFLRDLINALNAADLSIAGLHINTFNQVDAAGRWWHQQLAVAN